MSAPGSIRLFTHRSATDTGDAVVKLLDAAHEAGVSVRAAGEEIEKHALQADRRIASVEADEGAGDTDVAVVLGGDGTILSALREFARTGVPVFAFNFGAIGFLATVDEFDEGLELLLSGGYESEAMPALTITTEAGGADAAGDVSLHRRPGLRVAELGYAVDGEPLGRVRCDGLVASTPAGSTGYNLANGGPLLAWGVEGFVISFIAPHSLTARPVVAAPDGVLTIENGSAHEAVDITTDGRPAGELEPGERLDVRFERDVFRLALTPGSNFYHRVREKFGRIAY